MADYQGPGNQSPGNSFRSAPYSRKIVNADLPANLTGLVEQARCAASGAILFAAGATDLTYTDSTGASVVLTALPAGSYEFKDIALASVTTLTVGAQLLVYWHAQASR